MSGVLNFNHEGHEDENADQPASIENQKSITVSNRKALTMDS